MGLKIFTNVSLKRLLITAPFALFLIFLLYYVWWARFTIDEHSVLTKYTSYPSQVMAWNALEKRTAKQGLPAYALAKIEKAKPLGIDKQHEVLLTALFDIQYEVNNNRATPSELVANNKGDCDDFAYLWYNQLKAMGLPATVLYMTVILPENKNERFGHAVTLTKNAKGEAVVLDINNPMFSENFASWKKRYQVIFLYKGNENGLSFY